jgi:tRNA-Thr(GGU) m(6)t(6)A37 methyltransferase TsaA
MKKRQNDFEFAAIGYVRTPFKEKFGIPRQPGLVSKAQGIIKIENDPDLKTALKSLEEFSHLWIVFVFHEHGGKNWKPSIRPPRLGGNKKVGVLASRSPHRPNPIGLSAVALEKIDLEAKGGPEIFVNGVDLLDGTPVLDIKPYIAYADSIPDANAGWASEPIRKYDVMISKDVEEKIKQYDSTSEKNLRALMIGVLELDPRPAFQKRQLPVEDPRTGGTRYGFSLLGFDVKYEIRDGAFFVYDLLIL